MADPAKMVKYTCTECLNSFISWGKKHVDMHMAMNTTKKQEQPYFVGM